MYNKFIYLPEDANFQNTLQLLIFFSIVEKRHGYIAKFVNDFFNVIRVGLKIAPALLKQNEDPCFIKAE